MRTIIAQRTRSKGDWKASEHYAQLELQIGCSNSITTVQKDNLLLEIYASNDRLES